MIGSSKAKNGLLIWIPHCGNSKFFHCEPTLQLLIFYTNIQKDPKVPSFFKFPVQKVLNNLSRQVWLLVLKRAYSGDKIQPKIASYISWYFGFFHLLRPVNLSDIFEDDGPFSQQLSESPLLAQQSSLHKVSTVNTAFKTQSFGQVLVAFGPLQAKLGLVIFLKNCRLTQNCLKNGCWSLVLIRDASK